MMEEIASDEQQEIGENLADQNIAAQLLDAAQSNSGDDTWETVNSAQPASVPLSSHSVTQFVTASHQPQSAPSYLTTSAPPNAGFATVTTPSYQSAPPPKTGFVAGHANIASGPPRRVFASDESSPTSTSASNAPNIFFSGKQSFESVAPQQPAYPQYVPPPVAMQMSHETSAPFNVQIDEGYGGQGYSSQGQGYTSQGFSGQIYSTQGYAGQSQGYVNQDYGQSSYQQEEKEETGGFLSWFTSGSVVSKVMEKAKSSVETVITTLDPGMKEVLYSGGDVNIVVASTKDVKIGAIRQAFQEVFGRATITGMDSQPDIAPQPVGYTAGLKGCEDRIENIRRSGVAPERIPLIAVENFIVELLPERWFDIGCCLLRDHGLGVELVAFTTATPIPAEFVLQAHDQTPQDYGLRWSGLAITVGEVINQSYPHIPHTDWHLHFTGVSRRELIYMAAKVLAGMYKQKLQAPSVQ